MEDYERFLNGVAARRQASATRALASTTLAGKIQIYAGMPHPETFPLTKATVEVENGQDIVLEVKLDLSCQTCQLMVSIIMHLGRGSCKCSAVSTDQGDVRVLGNPSGDTFTQ